MKNNRSGFTLLELLMVVIIIAILAAIALPQYLRVSEKARGAEALSTVGAVRASQLRFRAQDPANLYSPIMADLDIDLQTSTLWSAPAIGTGGPPATGVVTVTRLTGLYSGLNVGISFGTGTLCGNFLPTEPLPDCGGGD